MGKEYLTAVYEGPGGGGCPSTLLALLASSGVLGQLPNQPTDHCHNTMGLAT